LEAFSQSLVDRSPGLQEKSRYNLGRTLEDRADLRKTNEDALKDLENSAQHYEQALKLDPQDKAAAERLEIVRKKIERLKKQPDQKKNEQRSAGESPTPTPDESSNPSPSPGESGENPSPSPGDNSGKDENVSPGATPSASPTKPRSGEIKSASEPSEPSDEQRKEQAAEAEA